MPQETNKSENLPPKSNFKINLQNPKRDTLHHKLTLQDSLPAQEAKHSARLSFLQLTDLLILHTSKKNLLGPSAQASNSHNQGAETFQMPKQACSTGEWRAIFDE